MPQVSILMPSYNHELYIGEAIESILNQSVTDLELIIVDDASKDGSADIIRAYQRQDDRIRVLFHESNTDVPKTYNDAMELATGTYVGTCSSDDLWFENAVEILLDRVHEHENEVVMGSGITVDKAGYHLGHLHAERVSHTVARTSGDILDELLRGLGPYFFIQTMMIKRDLVADIRMEASFKTMYEYAYFLELASRYHYYFTDDMVFKHRIHGDNQTFKVKAHLPDMERARVGRDYLDRFSSRVSQPTKIRLCQAIIKDALSRQDFNEIRHYVLYMMAVNPTLTDSLRAPLMQGRDPASLTISLDPDKEISFTLADIHLSLEDLAVLPKKPDLIEVD